MKHDQVHPLRRIRYTALALVATFALLAAPAVVAQDDMAEGAEGMGEESAEMMAMMEAWAKAATPGPMHEHVGRSEGEWVTTTKVWMEPGAEPMTSEGTMTGEWLHDGRFMETRHTGNIMGQPFQGTGVEAYDNVRETFVSTWIDSMSTGIMTMEGHCLDDACDKIEYEGPYADPMTGEMMNHRMVFTWHDDDTFTLEAYMETPDGEMKGMEMTAKKKG